MNRKLIIDALRRLGITFDGQASTAVLNGILRDTWLTIRNSADPEFEAGEDYDFEMTINGQIGTDYYGDQGYSARQFQDELKPFKNKRGLLSIHSPGGNVWDAFAICEMVRAHGNIDTKILGLAASSADVVFQAGQTRTMPKMAMRMAHGASALFCVAGNASELTAQKAELDKTIARLKKHNTTLATMYSNRSGNTIEEVTAMMDAEEFMDGDESLEKGFCDQLTDETPVVDQFDLGHLKKVPAAVLNQFSAAPKQGAAKPSKHQAKDTTVNKKQKIALLNSWGVKLPSGITDETVTDAWLDDEIGKGKPKATAGITRDQNLALLNGWGVKVEANATDADIENLVSAGKPKAAPQNANGNGNISNLDDHPTVKAMKASLENQRRTAIRARLQQFVSEDRIPAGQIQDWENDAFAATDDPVQGNPILNRLAQLEPRAPGVQAVNIDVGEEGLNVTKLDKVVCDLLKPSRYVSNNRLANPDNDTRKTIASRSRQISRLINSMKKVGADGTLGGPLRDAWDSWAAGVQNANTMSADLLRQVILSELMRAFRREFASLNLFAHNYKDVALQGTDKVEVPYYPLDQVASSEFKQADGYVIAPGAVTSSKEIQVGGKADGVASAGRGRKYKGLQFSAYEIARQPWLNIAQNIVMAAEQLAIDIRGDILGTHIKAANFGNAIWTGASGAFDKLAFTNYLLNAAIKAFWPLQQRHAILTPDFYTNLLGDPGLQRVNEAGDDAALRSGIIGRLLSFASVDYDALLPVANFIRGGDGAVTAGGDPNLAGFIAYPSAILIATAPIMPGPATMRLLASYEQVTDDQTGLTFNYQYFGNVLGSVDNEIIECTYGSNPGELAALKRLTTVGV